MVTVPSGFPDKNRTVLQYRLQQMISLNDCLYKHMYEYTLLLPIDFDEIILPSREEDKTWFQMLNRTDEMLSDFQQTCYLAVNHVFFLAENNNENGTQPGIPANMHFLQRVNRAERFSEPWKEIKSFLATENTIASNNHMPFECAFPTLGRILPRDIAQLHHYRRGCPNCRTEEYEDFRTHSVKDLTLWKYKEEIIRNVNKTLEALKIV